ncbi:hypothetical protein ACFTAO_07370 [Paenibacillus rhizoplanae]
MLPILISIEEWSKPLSPRDQEIMEYAVKKAAEECFTAEHPGEAVTDKSGVLFILLYAGGVEGEHAAKKVSLQQLTAIGKRFIQACQELFYSIVTCYVGSFKPPSGAAGNV